MVFRVTEVGVDWSFGSIGTQPLYPASQIGLSSDPTLLQTAYNTADEEGCWSNGNCTPTFYPATARVGYDPGTILSNLDSWIQNNTYPNLHVHSNGGGVENLNTVPATVTEMMLQSFQGVLRVFADWPNGSDAKFGSLRAYGAFLVPSAIQSNVIQYVGVNVGNLSGTSVTIQSCTNDNIIVAPEGTSYPSIIALVDTP